VARWAPPRISHGRREPPAEDAEQGEERAAEVEGGSYDVLRARLQAQGRELAEKADQLNGRRKETFGGSDLEIIGNEKIRTENNCIPSM
jgi:ribose 1,5-bisphosphokinase PhnN